MENALKERLANTEIIVFATNYEQQMLWESFAEEAAGLNGVFGNTVKWKDEPRGHLITFGELDNRPLCVTLNWAKINDKDVLFIEHTSQVCDFAALDEWLKEICPKAKKSDSMNFPLREITAK